MPPRFQFRLRTLFVVVTALCVLLSQWPLIEWETPRHAGVIYLTVGEGCYFVPMRVLVVAYIEASLLVAWLIWRWARHRSLS